MERIRWEIDEEYSTRGSYALATDEETTEAEDAEIAALESGEYIAVGYVHEQLCESCGQWEHKDSCWGIVVGNNADSLREWLTADGVLDFKHVERTDSAGFPIYTSQQLTSGPESFRFRLANGCYCPQQP